MLPSYNDLSEEQKGIVRRVSVNSGSLYVEGPAGSGKTLISLYAIQNFIEKEAGSILFLMYNKSLYAFLKSALDELGIVNGATIDNKDHYFFNKARILNMQIPQAPFKEKFAQIHQYLFDHIETDEFDVVVVDEVQDVQSLEFKVIEKLGKKIIALGDFAQSIYESDLKRTELLKLGQLENLTRIFRYHRGVAELAQNFTDNDITAMVNDAAQSAPQLIDVSTDQVFPEVGKILQQIQNQRKRVGILAPRRETLIALHNFLTENRIDHTYYNKNDDLKNHDFTSLQPLLLTSYSAKGLEFDKVIILGFDSNYLDIRSLKEDKKLKELLFVSMTRAIMDLYIIRTPQTLKEILDLKVSDEGEDVVDLEGLFD